MSARWRCNACGGTYYDTLPDGSAYRHACAPFDGLPEVLRVRLPGLGEGGFIYPRRDENLAPGPVLDQEGRASAPPSTIVSEGLGRERAEEG